MRHIYGILTSLTAMLLMVACTTDGTGSEPQQPATRLLLQGVIQSSNSAGTRTAGTEAIQSTHLEDGNRVGGFIYRHGTDAKETTGEMYGYTNYPFDTWQANYLYNPNQPLFPVQGAEQRVDIYAYAPYVDETVDASYGILNTAHTFTVKTDQTKRADFVASDLLWGYRNQDNTDPYLSAVTMVTPITTQNQIVPIKFSHMLSQVYVEISAGDGVTTDQLEGAEVKLNGVTLDGTLNFKTGALTCGTTTGTIKVLKCGYKYDTSGSQVLINKTTDAADYAAHFKGAAIVYPVATLPTTVTLTITTSAPQTFTAKLKTTAITKWEAGKKYQYQVRISKDGLSFTAAITPWDSSAPNVPVTPVLQ